MEQEDIYFRDILKDRSFALEKNAHRDIIAICSRQFNEVVLERGWTAASIDPGTNETYRGSAVMYYAYCDQLEHPTWSFNNTTLKLV